MAVADGAAQVTLDLLGTLFPSADERLAIRLWDGTTWPDSTPRRTTLVLNHPGALRSMLLPGTEQALGEAYLYGDVDILGEVEPVYGLAEDLSGLAASLRARLRVMRQLLRLPAERRGSPVGRGPARLRGPRHSVARDKQAVTYHYDVSAAFYRLWLDRRMVYSCAYFAGESDDLDVAQERKLDLLCRKLRLRPGQRLLDIGCGWGGLVQFAAERYGVDATGITLSAPQAEVGQEAIARAGVQERCRVRVEDYREVAESAPYDALVSVGMFEHVGEARLPAYFAKAWRLLRPGGVFVNHGIARRITERSDGRGSFSAAYVFPDGELAPISASLGAAEMAGFEVRDVESLREHYALTLRRWVSRLEARHGEALQIVDEPTYRVWRLFMAGSAHGFASGRLNVYQALLVRTAANGDSGLPLTRADWYA